MLCSQSTLVCTSHATNAPPAATATIRRSGRFTARRDWCQSPASHAADEEQQEEHPHEAQLGQRLHLQAVGLADVLARAALEEVEVVVVARALAESAARP